MPTITTAQYWTTVRRESSLVSYWRNNEASSVSQATDYAARYALTGLYQGTHALGPTLIQNDASAGSMVVGSGSPGFKVPDTSQLEIVGDLSIEVYMAPWSSGQSCQILGKLDSSNTYANPYSLQLVSGALCFSLGDGSAQVSLTGGTPPVSAPSHVVATCHRGAMSIYLNGALVASGTLGSQSVTDGGEPLWVGSVGGSSDIFSGLQAETAIYSGALSLRRIQRHYDLAQQIYPDQAHFLGVDPPVLTG